MSSEATNPAGSAGSSMPASQQPPAAAGAPAPAAAASSSASSSSSSTSSASLPSSSPEPETIDDLVALLFRQIKGSNWVEQQQQAGGLLNVFDLVGEERPQAEGGEEEKKGAEGKEAAGGDGAK